jgi:hypothetical protein
LFAIPVATFGGVHRGSKVEVVAGAHVYPADPIGVQWDSIGAGMNVSLPPVFRKWIASVEVVS